MRTEKLDAKKLCRLGQGPATCRYLVMGSEGFDCIRHTLLAEDIDARVERGDFKAQGRPETCCESVAVATPVEEKPL